MEKRTPHYALKDIQAQMQTVEDMSLTKSAQQGISSLRMDRAYALLVIRTLTAFHFHKSMTTYQDHRVWQDVYHTEFRDIPLYVKFQKLEKYFVVSFKERNHGRQV